MLLKAFVKDYELKLDSNEVKGPSSPRDYLEWNARLKKWRFEQQNKTQSITVFDIPTLKWTQKSYIQSHVMLNDLYLYNPETNQYTVDRYLQDLQERLGVIHSVVIWPSLPNIGCDGRNNEDYFRCLPGGITAIRNLVKEFQMRNIKVLFPVLDWDIGTRDPQERWCYIIPRFFKEYNIDGLSTAYSQLNQDYWLNSIAIRYPFAFHSDRVQSNSEYWNTIKSTKFDSKVYIPTVSKEKLIEPRLMVRTVNKWSRNKTSIIQHAFFNGIGVEIWENMFGCWNGFSPRDAEALRRISHIFQCFGPDFFSSPAWEPHIPSVHYNHVFVSQFPSQSQPDQILWTLINKSRYQISGPQLVVPYRVGIQFFDVWRGQELIPTDIMDGLATLSFDLEPLGYGCVLAKPDLGKAPAGFDYLLKLLNRLSILPLSHFELSHSVLWQALDEVIVTTTEKVCGMVRIEGGLYDFKLSPPDYGFDDYPGVDIRYPWEYSPTRHHATFRMKLQTFYIDPYPVTESQFKEFLDQTGYQPKDPKSFLKHWINGHYPIERANKPVVHVSIEDARAYASWAGKRLPHEWEWQYVAQAGTEYRIYPWGNTWDPTKIPTPYSGRERLYPDHPPANVNQYPAGRSLFGVYDLVGNVWQWTDVYQSDRTRIAVIRGGSYYQPQHTFYFPQAYRNDQHGKYLLMAPSIDRCGTIGFRCVKDTVESAAALGNCSFSEGYE